MKTSEIRKQARSAVQRAIAICGTQVELASKAGITQGAIGKYIRLEAAPTGLTAKKLSKAVNGVITPAEFAPHIFGE